MTIPPVDLAGKGRLRTQLELKNSLETRESTNRYLSATLETSIRVPHNTVRDELEYRKVYVCWVPNY
jgi:hypothetical protein